VNFFRFNVVISGELFPAEFFGEAPKGIRRRLEGLRRGRIARWTSIPSETPHTWISFWAMLWRRAGANFSAGLRRGGQLEDHGRRRRRVDRQPFGPDGAGAGTVAKVGLQLGFVVAKCFSARPGNRRRQQRIAVLGQAIGSSLVFGSGRFDKRLFQGPQRHTSWSSGHPDLLHERLALGV